ncbi:hypothetical protein ACHAWO_008154 [Cyclotella atomus]|uniref:Uncharacterized protein n=1 Tax=Cyclotella atomus TaxID=382360 RepID=A0ABD3PL82_9STRA
MSSKSTPSNNDEETALKKRKETAAKLSAMFASSNDSNGNDNGSIKPLSEIGGDFTPCSLVEIQKRMKGLMDALPKVLPGVPEENDINDSSFTDNTPSHQAIKSFASSLQIVIEQYNLLLSLVSSATYKWGVDRSGASQQNLSVMVSELQQCQEMISTTVSGRLSNVLCPAVDVLVGEVEIIRGGSGNNDNDGDDARNKKRKLNKESNNSSSGTDHNNSERRINHYIRAQVDPAYVHLSHVILARNAEMIRHTVATSIFTAQQVISDYLKAMQKDTGDYGHNSFNL